MDNVTGNCTSTKADVTVKAIFDGNKSGQQAFMYYTFYARRRNVTTTRHKKI